MGAFLEMGLIGIVLKGSVAEGQERWDRMWPRVSGGLRRSFSWDRKGEGGMDGEGGKRRSRNISVSPGLEEV
jgi:hypothetical protein